MGPVVFIIERVKSGNYGAKIGKNDNLANNDYVIQIQIIVAVLHKGLGENTFTETLSIR